MRSVDKRVKRTGRRAAALATEYGKKAAKRAAAAADSMIVKLGDAAKKRQRARKAKSALKTAGKVALVLGAGAATVFGARRVMSGTNGDRKRK